MKFKLKQKSINTVSAKRGFTLLLATLIASLMVALGMSMFVIAQKEVRLSSIVRDSQFAFYAADSGAECALYLHYLYDAFATSTVFSDTNRTKCDEQTLLENGDSQPGGLGGAVETRFRYDLQGVDSLGNVKEYCVNVRVIKSAEYPNTQISSLGYNVSCDALENDSRRVLERAVRMEL